ncbi:MAG: GtrA family protein [Dermatophilaceae bacterium]
MTQARETLTDRLRAVVGIFWRELAKFGVVGAVAFVVDLGGFNLLFYGPLSGRLATSKVIAGGAATAVAWLGNRFWTFRHRRNRPVHHEAMLFFVVNGIGLAIATAYLNATHDLLHLTSPRWVNVNNIVGIALATVFRFWAYRRWVFAGEHPGDLDGASAEPEAESATPATQPADHFDKR